MTVMLRYSFQNLQISYIYGITEMCKKKTKIIELNPNESNGALVTISLQ